MPINVGTLTPVTWSRPSGHVVTLTVTKPDGTELAPAVFEPVTLTWSNGWTLDLSRLDQVVTAVLTSNGSAGVATVLPLPAPFLVLGDARNTEYNSPTSPTATLVVNDVPATGALGVAHQGSAPAGTVLTARWLGETIDSWPLAVTEDGGVYSAELPCDLPGRYVLHWHDVTDSVTHVDILDVWPTDPRFLISLDDAADALQWRDADKKAKLDSLAVYVAAATEVIEDITGAVLVRTIVQPSDGGRTGVALWERPSSIASVTVNGAAATGYVTNLNAAIVYADGRGGRFADGVQNIVITYQVGAEAVPTSIRLAARELIRHLWQLGQQAGSPPQPALPTNPQQTTMTRSGFAVPNRVIELCGNHYALPGIA